MRAASSAAESRSGLVSDPFVGFSANGGDRLGRQAAHPGLVELARVRKHHHVEERLVFLGLARGRGGTVADFDPAVAAPSAVLGLVFGLEQPRQARGQLAGSDGVQSAGEPFVEIARRAVADCRSTGVSRARSRR